MNYINTGTEIIRVAGYEVENILTNNPTYTISNKQTYLDYIKSIEAQNSKQQEETISIEEKEIIKEQITDNKVDKTKKKNLTNK